MSETQAALSGTQAKLAGLKEQLSKLPARVVAETDNAAADKMRADLFTLQLREKELMAKFTESHPKVRAIHRQVVAAQEVVAAEQSVRNHVTENVNSAYKEVELAMLHEQTSAAGLTAQLEEYTQNTHQIQLQMRALNENEIQIAELTRNVDLLESSYRKAYAAYEQSRISDALERERISNVNVVQEPSQQHKPIAPRSLEVFVLSVFVAVFASFGLALVCDTWEDRVRQRQVLSEEFLVPTTPRPATVATTV